MSIFYVVENILKANDERIVCVVEKLEKRMKKTFELDKKKKKASFFNKGFLFNKSFDKVSLNDYKDLNTPRETEANFRRINGNLNRKKSSELEKNPIYEEIIIQHDHVSIGSQQNEKSDNNEEPQRETYFDNADDGNSWNNSNSNNNTSNVNSAFSFKITRFKEEELKQYDVLDYSVERTRSLSDIQTNSVIDMPAPKRPSSKKTQKTSRSRNKSFSGNRRSPKVIIRY